MSSKNKVSGRVILNSEDIQKRLCSLHLNIVKKELLIDFKKPLTVVSQGLFNKKTGNIIRDKVEIKQIQHLHYIIPQQKILATYREKGDLASHSNWMFFNPRVRDGKYLQWFLRIIPNYESLLTYEKTLEASDFVLNVPSEALNKQLALDFWLGFSLDSIQRLQIHKKLIDNYQEKEAAYYDSILGDKEELAIFVVMFLPKEAKIIYNTRLLIPNIVS